jgi:hypothetical protein
MILIKAVENAKVVERDNNVVYEHYFHKCQDENDPKQIYVTTPSNMFNHVASLKQTFGNRTVLEEVKRDNLPPDIGFGKLTDEHIKQFRKRQQIRVAIINGMSNAVGDYLIGMQAFLYWHEMISRKIKPCKLSASFYQISPHRLMNITQQWTDKIGQIYLLPSPLSTLMEHDAYIDLAGLVTLANFATSPMIDFFFSSLSIDPDTVPAEKKRNKYIIPLENKRIINEIFQIIRLRHKKILLFHPSATSELRSINIPKAREIVRQILQKTDFFVVSAVGIDYQHKRFLDLSPHSATVDDFAAIISNVDNIITVDTATYHIADAFSIPTVALFTSIKPEYRIKYYPYCAGIMLEKEDGFIFGKHKLAKEKKLRDEQLAYVDDLWSHLDVDFVLSQLPTKDHK